MPKLTLGTYMLPPGEVLLIRTLMRIFSHDRAFGWELCEQGPYDGLIMDNAMTTAQGSETAAGAVLRLTPGHDAPSGNTLQRPIKAEKLQGWLKNAALELLGRHPVAPDASVAGANLLAMKQARFKLLRWPSSALLQNDASLIRMSSLLSRRALHLSELAELSHQSIECCFAFIEKLLPMKMVTCEFMAPLAGAPASFAVLLPTPAMRPAAPAHARIPFHQSLISKIRKHLGI